VTEDDPDPLVNTVLVSGNGADGTDSQETDIIHPAIHLDKSADVDSATPGETIHYRYDVTNTGDVELSNVTVDDDVLGKICTFSSPLAPGETRTCRARYVVPTNAPTEITNVAVASGAYAAPASPSVSGRARGLAASAAAGAQNVVSDSDKVTITVVAGVTVTPTKTPPGGLAFTGSEAVMPLIALALLLLTAGTWLMWVARRRGRGEASAE
jgi:uncharacterized repeat protein (TIGR01451 family)